LPSKNRLYVEQFLLPKLIKNIREAVILYPVFPPGYLTYILKSNNVKILPTIHDTVIWNYSSTLSLTAKIYLKPLYHLTLKKADKIITISATVKKELEKLTNIEILNFSNCISDIYKNINDVNTNILNKLNVQENSYILSVSTIEPRKNLEYLLEVYNKLLSSGYNKKLILVGRKGWGNNKKLEKLINHLKEHIIFTDFISNEDLITLYKNSYSFWLFSKYEGFGRPPLEALACGSDVVVSDIPIFREVLKNDVTYIPLNDINKSFEIIKNKTINKIKKYNYSFERFSDNLKKLNNLEK
jgi:glycosyltransferase involved in cell wall biosynthesis